MMRQTLSLFFFAVILLAVYGCKKDGVTSTPQLHLNYFDMTEGRYVVYKVMEVYHDDDSGIHDTSEFFLKTVNGATYIDNSGRVGLEQDRYESLDNVIWQLTDTWTQFRTNIRAELVEENQKKIKLAFAPTFDKEWDINAFNAFDEQQAYYSAIHESFEMNGISFDSTVNVVQEDFFSLVDLKRQTERYAKNIGLVSKYYKDLIIQNFDTLNPIKGEELFYEIVDFGIE